jgi:hypothetical protein
MPNTLGLDDDLDGVEVVRDLQLFFDIKVSNEEAERIFTVGEFHDLLLRKIPGNEADRKCAGAMTFFRLRGALRRLGYGQEFTPASDMRILERGSAKSNLKELERESGLDLPKAVVTRIGCLAALFCFFAISTIGILCLLPAPPGSLLALLAGSAVLLGPLAAGAIIKYIDPGRLPANCATLADLTKKTALINYGRLIRMGARHRDDDIWDNLLEAPSRYALPKSEITRETFFLHSQLKKNAVA